VDNLLHQFQISRASLALALEHNERRSMNIALDYLDQDNDNNIRQQDCPQLSLRLFAILDPSHQGKVSPYTLNEAIVNLSVKLGEAFTRIQQLRVGISANPNDAAITLLKDLEDHYHADRQMLREINAYFHQCFVGHVFNTLNEDVKKETVDLGLLQKFLNEVESQMIVSMDPLNNNTSAIITSNSVSNVPQSAQLSQVLAEAAIGETPGINSTIVHTIGLAQQKDIIEMENILTFPSAV